MNNMSFSTLNTSFQRVVQQINYLWDPEPKNTEPMSAIWLLGQDYSSPTPPPAATDAEIQSTWPRAFLDDFESRVWMTYRSDFEPIPRSPQGTQGMSIMTSVRAHLPAHSQGFTSDQGWGCMVRSGQCVLANALLVLRFGREWRKGQRTDEEKKLLALFADDPSAPFSIHRFVRQGELRDIHSGQWFGPTPTAQCIKALTEAYPDAGLRVHMTFEGGNVYEDTFRATAVAVDGVFQPTLLLIVTRLGVDSINPLYWESLKATLRMKQSIGIAGGRPSSSHYFVGVQGEHLFYLDPHVVRPRLTGTTNADVESCHTVRLRRLHLREVDPSMMFAFLIRSEQEWTEWKAAVGAAKGRSVITVGEKEPDNKATTERSEAIDEVISESDGEGDLLG